MWVRQFTNEDIIRLSQLPQAEQKTTSLPPAANQRQRRSYHAEGGPGSGMEGSAGRCRRSLVMWRGTSAAAAANSSGGTTEGRETP